MISVIAFLGGTLDEDSDIDAMYAELVKRVDRKGVGNQDNQAGVDEMVKVMGRELMHQANSASKEAAEQELLDAQAAIKAAGQAK